MANYYCQYCGSKWNSISQLTINPCRNSPTKKHILYEGSEKAKYVCKYCGSQWPDILSLTANPCRNSPTKRHRPAL